RHPVRTDVGDHEFPLESVTRTELFRCLRLLLEEGWIDPIGYVDDLLVGDPDLVEVSTESLRDDHDPRRPAVQEPLEPDERAKDERTLQRPELDRGLGPDVAELEDERDAEQAAQDVCGDRYEELRRGTDDDIRPFRVDAAQGEGGK